MRRHLPLILVLAVFAIGLGFILTNRKQPLAPPEPTPPPVLSTGPALSNLATAPDWAEIEAFHDTLTRELFQTSLTKVSALPDSWQSTITIEEDSAWVRHHGGPDSGESKITFATELSPLAPLPPLNQLHIAIDPGHIGGEFALLEQRNFQPFEDDPDQIPVREGELTLATAKHLKPLLEKLGAKVTLVRETNAPVTNQRPEDFLPDFPDRLTAEKVFYRTAEIRARADLVNNLIQPDLVLCLHYNADGWADPENPWASRNHFHLLMHGAYMPGEVALDDQRFEMLRHLYTQSTQRALPLAKIISDVFLRETDLVPYHYISTAPALRVDPTRPIYARNLLANRLYQAPTIFLEPYVMNHRDTYDRVQLGDYSGFREFKGQNRRSLVQEYAHTLASGIAEYFLNPTP
ncbi:MAG: N-acetylmuramoyl-L-alanine amidase family protein [Roseibacillus sp.]